MTHVSTVHAQPDVRIAGRECRSLAEAGYRVTLVGQSWHEAGIDSVERVDLGSAVGRWRRVFQRLPQALFAVLRTRPSIVHLHDPELLMLAPVFRAAGCRVIYDAHEDLPRQILHKTYIPLVLRRPLAACAAMYETLFLVSVHRVVAATDGIAARFAAKRAVAVRNFPRKDDFLLDRPAGIERPATVTYIGGVSVPRGAAVMLSVGRLLQDSGVARLEVCGPIESENLRQEFAASEAAGHVTYRGNLRRADVIRLLMGSHVGLALLAPTPAYREAYPVKVFEYLAAGIPVVLSDFPEWRRLFGASPALRYVDPGDARAAADAVRSLLADHVAWTQASSASRQLFVERFTWEGEQATLLRLYEDLQRSAVA